MGKRVSKQIVVDVLDFGRNKTKKVTLAFNPDLYGLFMEEADKENKKPLHKLEDLMVEYLKKKGRI